MDFMVNKIKYVHFTNVNQTKTDIKTHIMKYKCSLNTQSLNIITNHIRSLVEKRYN